MEDMQQKQERFDRQKRDLEKERDQKAEQLQEERRPTRQVFAARGRAQGEARAGGRRPRRLGNLRAVRRMGAGASRKPSYDMRGS